MVIIKILAHKDLQEDGKYSVQTGVKGDEDA